MKIVYISLTGDTSFVLYPNRHDGGGCFARYAKQILNNNNDEFWIYAPKEAFNNYCEEDNMSRAIFITKEQIEFLKKNGKIADIFPELRGFDILIHNEDYFGFNINDTKLKQVTWLGFVNQTVLPSNHAGLFYHEEQMCRFCPQTTKMYKIKIGKYVSPNFISTKKEDFLFSCVRNDFLMATGKIAKICNEFKIKAIFAGPIGGAKEGGDYKITEFIDNKNTFYIGAIPEQLKLDIARRARLYNCAQEWDTIFSLSAIESLSVGTPIIAYNRGCFKYLVKDGYNGYFYNGKEEQFLEIWEKSKNIDQKNCWLSGKEYSHEEMVDSFYSAFCDLIK